MSKSTNVVPVGGRFFLVLPPGPVPVVPVPVVPVPVVPVPVVPYLWCPSKPHPEACSSWSSLSSPTACLLVLVVVPVLDGVDVVLLDGVVVEVVGVVVVVVGETVRQRCPSSSSLRAPSTVGYWSTRWSRSCRSASSYLSSWSYWSWWYC